MTGFKDSTYLDVSYLDRSSTQRFYNFCKYVWISIAGAVSTFWWAFLADFLTLFLIGMRVGMDKWID